MEGQLHLCLGSNRSEKRVGEGRLLSLCMVTHKPAQVQIPVQAAQGQPGPHSKTISQQERKRRFC